MASTASLSAPLVLAAMGGLASERSGIVNIALEGKMLAACVLTAVVGWSSGNAFLGLAAGMGGAVVFSALHYAMTQAFRIDQIVSGMAINALGYGMSNYLGRKLIEWNPDGRFARLPEGVYLGLAALLPVAIWIYLARTRGGLRLRAVGEDPVKARQMGISTAAVRLCALLATGVFCGLAGALVVSSAGTFVDSLTAGRGFIALAALIVGGWRPLPALAACVLFGLLQALQILLQGQSVFGLELPNQVWQALPYVATVVALAGFLGKNRAPAGLGKP